MEDLFNFETALAMLKAGHKMTRKKWNGKGMFIRVICPKMDEEVNVPYIYMDFTSTADDGKTRTVPWVASQVDLLCEDWMLVSEN